MRNAQHAIRNAPRATSLFPEPFDAGWARTAFSLLLFCLAALPASAARDPFWPIGYEPPKPEPAVKETREVPKKAPPQPVSAKPAPPRPKPPAVKPVTDGDWADARALITVTGFTRATRPDTGETRALALINRHSYAPGDTLCLTNAGIAFLWRIDSLDNRELKLAPLQASRIAPPGAGPSGSAP